MPTEYEFKYVLSPKVDKEVLKEEISYITFIDQGTLLHDDGMYVRIRHSVNHWSRLPKKWTMAFKSRSGRPIEIEQSISEDDWNDLWPKCHRKVSKQRLMLRGNFELDIFTREVPEKLLLTPYFWLLEKEVDLAWGDSVIAHPPIPDYLQKHLLWAVPYNDPRITNDKLADPEYAAKVYSLLEEGRISELP